MTLEIYQEPSPLVYDRSSNVQRFGLLDPELASIPFEPRDTYFAQTQRTIRRGANGRELKKPRIEITPGSKPGTLAWVDWHPLGNGWLYIDFIKVRQDARGGRYGSKVIEAFYHDVVAGQGYQGVHWGRVMHPHAWTVMQRMKREWPNVIHTGHHDF